MVLDALNRPIELGDTVVTFHYGTYHLYSSKVVAIRNNSRTVTVIRSNGPEIIKASKDFVVVNTQIQTNQQDYKKETTHASRQTRSSY